jgi:hypothetical protein
MNTGLLFCSGRRDGLVGADGAWTDLTGGVAFEGVTGVSTSNLGTAGRDEELLAAGVEGFLVPLCLPSHWLQSDCEQTWVLA